MNLPQVLILGAYRATVNHGERLVVNLVNRVPLPDKGRIDIAITDPFNREAAGTQYEIPLLPGIQPPEGIRVEFSDIETVRIGQGAVLFCQYRVFEKLNQDPLAIHLAYNLLQFDLDP